MGDSGGQNRFGRTAPLVARDGSRSTSEALALSKCLYSKNAMRGTTAKQRSAQLNLYDSSNVATSTLKAVTAEQRTAAIFTAVIYSIVISASLLLGIIVTILAVGIMRKVGLVLH